MSRYNLVPFDPSLEVTVGYDPPLSTYFANVVRLAPTDTSFDEDDPAYCEDEIVMMIGCFVNEVDSVDKLAAILQPYATIPDEVRDAMKHDASQPYELSPLQIMMRRVGLKL